MDTTTRQRARWAPSALLLVAAAGYVLAGGWVHFREWLDLYRHVPAGIPGAFVVKVGFPVHAVASVAAAVALLTAAVRGRFAVPVSVAVAAFEVGSIVTLILTRTGAVFGWSEPSWSNAADQTRAVEAAAVLCLAGWAAVSRFDRFGAVPPSVLETILQ